KSTSRRVEETHHDVAAGYGVELVLRVNRAETCKPRSGFSGAEHEPPPSREVCGLWPNRSARVGHPSWLFGHWQQLIPLRFAGLHPLAVFRDNRLELRDHRGVVLRHVELLAWINAKVIQLRRVVLCDLGRSIRRLREEVRLPRAVPHREQLRAAVVE